MPEGIQGIMFQVRVHMHAKSGTWCLANYFQLVFQKGLHLDIYVVQLHQKMLQVLDVRQSRKNIFSGNI